MSFGLKHKPILLLTVLLLLTSVANIKTDFLPVAPSAQAVHGGNPAIVAVWNEAKKSNVIIDSSLTAGIIVVEINGTDPGQLKGFDITVKYAGTILTTVAANVTFGSGLSGTSSPDCPRAEGCVFDRVTVTTSVKTVDNVAGSLRLAITVTDPQTPSVDGTGTLFRIKFKPTGTRGISLINIDDGASSLANPGVVPYQSIDGFFDNRATLEYDYSVVLSSSSLTIVRSVDKVKFVDSVISNNFWNTGEAVVLDSDNDGTYDSGETVISGSPTVGATLKADPRLKIVDGNGDGAWQSGEGVIYDTDNNSAYNAGEPVIAAPQVETDSKIKFVDTGNTVWNSGETVVYDSGNNGVYDPKIKYRDADSGTTWTPGELVFYDVNTNGVFDSGTDTVIAGTAPGSGTVRNDPKLRFVDGNGNRVWDSGEPVAYDADLNGKYDTKLRFVDPNNSGLWEVGEAIVQDNNLNGIYDSGETVIAGTPTVGASLKSDPGVRYFDGNNNNVWNAGEAVVHDSNLSGSYDLKIRYVDSNNNNVWNSGEALVNDINLNGVFDTRVRFLDANNNNVWNSGEGVIYDSSFNGFYDSGERVLLRPSLKTDALIKFNDTINNNLWDFGETVVYDTNNNNVYNTGEPIIQGSPGNGGAIESDPLLKYLDPNNNNVWNSNGNTNCVVPTSGSCEGVAYDKDKSDLNRPSTNSLYDAGEPVILRAPVLTDPKLKIVDGDGSGTLDQGEGVVYDSDNDNAYDAGEPIVAQLFTDPRVKFRDNLVVNAAWDVGEAVVYDLDNDNLCDDTDLDGICDEPLIDGTAPAAAAALATDTKIRLVDSDGNNLWTLGGIEIVIYDSNSNNLYDSGETSIAVGTPSTGSAGSTPTAGSLLKTDIGDPVVNLAAAPLALTTLKVDGKIRFEDTDESKIWDAGETLIYDSDNNGVYDGTETIIIGFAPDAGTAIIGEDPVIAGTTPAPGATLETDIGDNIVAGTTPLAGTVLKTDIGDPVIGGSVPLANTALSTDAKLKYADNNGNNARDVTEGVVYDTDSDNLYDSGEPVISAIPADLDSGTRGSSVTVTVSKVGGTANPTVTLRALSLPQGVTATFSTLSGTAPFTSTLTLSATGGAPGTGTTTPAGSYRLVVTGNTTTAPSHMVKAAGLLFQVDHPTGPGYTISSTPREEAVVYDVNNNGQFDLGTDIVFTGENPATALSTDSKIRFRDGNDAWDPNEAVIYDTDGDGKFDTGETVINGTAPANQTPGEADLKLRYFDTNNNNVWDAGEPLIYDANTNSRYDGHIRFADSNNNQVRTETTEGVFYDSNMNGLHDTGEPVIAVATLRTADSDTLTRLKFVDANGNNAWNTGETVVRDSDTDGLYDLDEPVITGSTPLPGTALKTDANLRYVDNNNNNRFDFGEGVAYSTDGTYNTGDTLIAEIPVKIELRLKFVDANSNKVWDTGEVVVRDTDNDNIYDTGEPVIAGTTPANGTALKADLGETIINASAATPSSNAVLKNDSKVRLIDGTNGVWDGPTSTRKGESVVYDTDNDNVYDEREGVFSRETSPTGVALSSDSKLKFVDGNSNGSWDPALTLFQAQFALVNVNGTITSGTPEAVQLATTPQFPLNGGDVTFNPSLPALGFVSMMNVSAGTTPAGIYRFNVTAQSTGTFSETPTGVLIQDFFVRIQAHDVSVGAVTTTAHLTNRNFAYETVTNPAPVDIKVTATNKGSFTETFTITVKGAGVTIGTATVTNLAAGASTQVTMTWTPWTEVRGSYAIKATASSVAGEVVLTDNSARDGTFVVRFKGDVTNDCAVNVDDLARVGAQFGKISTSPGFDTNADLNNDGAIQVDDLAAVGTKFGQSCP